MCVLMKPVQIHSDGQAGKAYLDARHVRYTVELVVLCPDTANGPKHLGPLKGTSLFVETFLYW